MKKLVRTLLTLALAAGMLMSLGVTAYADSAELATEKVGYGYGCPDAAAVDMHGAAADALTLDGIAIELRCEDGTAYIRVTDLAAVKLLRENTAKISELGIDLSKLYIKDGLILIKEDGMTADELAELEAKISELTRTATIKLEVGDKFTLAGGGVAAVCIEIGGFNAPPAQQAEEEEAPAVEEAPKRQLRVEGCAVSISSDGPQISAFTSKTPEVTTLYVTYSNSQGNGIDVYANDTSTTEENDYAVVGSRCDASYIFLVKSENDSATYYYSTGNVSYTEITPNQTYKILTAKTEETFSDISSYFTRNEINNIVNNTEISISSSASKDDEIVHIQYNNATPKTFNPNDKNSGYLPESGNASYEHVEKNNCITITSAEEGKTVDEAQNLTANIKNDIYTLSEGTTNGPNEERSKNENTSSTQSLTGANTNPVVMSTPIVGGDNSNPNPVVTAPGGEPAGESNPTPTGSESPSATETE